jgi:MFS family permease
VRPTRTGLWRHPDFLKLWAGQTVSTFGSLVGGIALQFTAILWLDASPIEISVLAACQLVPGFLVGLAAGVWVDRLRRRPILIATDAGRAVALATIPLAAVLGVLTIGQLFVVAFVANALTVFFDVAYEAYLPSLVGRGALVEGNSKLTATASVAEFGAFSVSGWLVQLLGAPATVLIDALSFVWSACFVGAIRAGEPALTAKHERQSTRREAVEGMRLVLHGPILRSLAVAGLVLRFCERIIGALILLYLNREVGFSPGVLGVIFAVGGLTSFGGALLAGRSARIGGLGPVLVIALLLRAGGVVFIPLAGNVSAISVAFLVLNQLITDPAWSFYSINEVSLRQAVTPDRLQGRMNASIRVLEFGAMLAGTVCAGLLGEVAGLRAALWVAAGGMFTASLWLLLSPVFALREMPGVQAAEEAAMV